MVHDVSHGVQIEAFIYSRLKGREICQCALLSPPLRSRVGYREPVPIWNRFQYTRSLHGPKCNADFGASFRCLSQLNTVARQIPWVTCKTAPASNVNFVLCRS